MTTMLNTNFWGITLGHRYRNQRADKVVEYIDEQLKVNVDRSIPNGTETSVNSVIKEATLTMGK